MCLRCLESMAHRVIDNFEWFRNESEGNLAPCDDVVSSFGKSTLLLGHPEKKEEMVLAMVMLVMASVVKG
jgi:hypothetical protein